MLLLRTLIAVFVLAKTPAAAHVVDIKFDPSLKMPEGPRPDKSENYTVVTKITDASTVTENLNSGCYVSGLYLMGADWDIDNDCLGIQKPKVLVIELPLLQVIPIEISKLKLQGTFRTPVYVTEARRNAMGVGMVFEADLASHEHQSHWVLQGVALCLNTDA